MPRYNPKTFTKPESLKAMDPAILRQLFGRFADFFESKGLKLDEIPPGEKLPYGHLAELIAAPEGAPELAEALYIIDEMATEKRFDDLIDRATAMKLLDSLKDPTPADLATALWLADPVALQRMHASSYLDRQRRFLYFYEDASEFSWDGPSERELVSLERDLDNWFIGAKRGIGCKVFYFFRNEEHWFLVWHGLPYRREGTVVEGEPGSVVYRPEKYDVLGYHPERGELKIHAATKKEVAMYREYLADLLIGTEATFRVVDRYSLEPLQSLGPKALLCHDVPGIAWIKLQEIRYDWGGPQGEIEIRRAKDIFAAFADDGRTVPKEAKVQSAKFAVAFQGGKRSRSVVLRPPNVVHYTRDPDSIPIEDWLRKRGFYAE